jgi:hypothetical protein
MSNYYDDDFSFQPKFKDGFKQKGGAGSGSSKRDQVKRKKGNNNTKEMYNSKYIRVMEQKKEKSKQKRIVGNQ